MRYTRPKNTGVMLIDVPRFQREIPSLVSFRNNHPEQTIFRAFDQDWLNLYFSQTRQHELGRHMLPLYWNWKLYWRLEPAHFTDLKIVHFHGPKPDRGAWKMATCETNLTDFWPREYHGTIHDGTCCDHGKTAYRVQQFFEEIRPPNQAVC